MVKYAIKNTNKSLEKRDLEIKLQLNKKLINS